MIPFFLALLTVSNAYTIISLLELKEKNADEAKWNNQILVLHASAFRAIWKYLNVKVIRKDAGYTIVKNKKTK